MLTRKKKMSALQIFRFMGFGSYKTACAAWVFTRRGGDWTQEKKLVGAEPAASVAASTNDGIVMIGGSNDHSSVGATAAFRGGGVADHQEQLAPPAPSDHTLSWEE